MEVNTPAAKSANGSLDEALADLRDERGKAWYLYRRECPAATPDWAELTNAERHMWCAEARKPIVR